MKKHQTTIGKNNEWITPPSILKSLGEFDLDPCAPIERVFETAKRYFTILDNGLFKEWEGRVWLNPPFNRYERGKFMEKMAKHNNGIMLIPAALETKHSKSYVWGKASGILFLDHRPHFHYANGDRAKANSGCTICLIAYGEENLKTLIDSKLGYVVRELNQ